MVGFCAKCGKPNEPGRLCTCVSTKKDETELLTLDETSELEVLTLEETKELEVLSLDETKELKKLSISKKEDPEVLSLEKTSKIKVIEPKKVSIRQNNNIEPAKTLTKSNSNTKQAKNESVQQVTVKRNFLKKCLAIVIDYVKNPFNTIENNITSCKMPHIISIIILNSISFGLFATVLLKDLLNVLYDIMLKISEYISFSEKVTSIEIPYVKSVIIFAILCFIFINMMSFATTIIINKVLKLKTSITKVMKIYGLTSITSTITFILSCISSLLNTHITPIILLTGLFLNQYYINMTMPNICRNKDNRKLGYAVAISPILAITTLVLLIISFI